MVMLPAIAIEAESLGKKFGTVNAVSDISLSIPTGSVCGLLGANGAGKTTTVRMLATLIRPDSGSARIFGRDVVRHATAVRSMIALTGQYASLDEDLTAEQNLELFATLRGFDRRAARSRAHELIEQFGLGYAASRPVSGFSGGMRRRLDIATSLISAPPLLFLDEPTTGLDPTTRTQMWAVVRDLVDNGTTVLLTTQYLDEADKLSDSIVLIDSGRVVAEGTAKSLKERIGTRTLHLHLEDRSRMREAAEIVGAMLSADVVQIPAEGALSVITSEPGRAAHAVSQLESAGIGVAEFSFQRPTLDDVFFAMTTGESTRA